MKNDNPKPDFYSLYLLVGEMKASIDSNNRKLEKYMEECEKRMNCCELKIEEHTKIIATARGKVSIIGSIWGSVSAVGVSLLIWYLTK